MTGKYEEEAEEIRRSSLIDIDVLKLWKRLKALHLRWRQWRWKRKMRKLRVRRNPPKPLP